MGASSLREVAVTVLVSILLATVAMYLEYKGVYAGLEGQLVDRYMSSRSAPATGPVIAVTISGDDYRRYFKAQSPLPHETVKSLVETILTAKPAVLAVDILTTSPGWADWADPRRRPRADIPIVWAASAENAQVESPDFFRWMFGAHDRLLITPGEVLGELTSAAPADVIWGVPVYPSDDDGAVRRLSPVYLIGKPEEPSSTFASVVAEKACEVLTPTADCHHQSEHVTFLPATPPDQGNRVAGLDRHVQCSTWVEKDAECATWSLRDTPSTLKGAVVLLGGDYPEARDEYVTTGDHRLPGVVMNANAVRLALEGLEVGEAPRLLAFFLDVAIGCVVGLVFHSKRSLRSKTQWSLAIVPVAILLSWILLRMDMLWVSWGVVLVSGVGWHVVWENVYQGGASSSAVA